MTSLFIDTMMAIVPPAAYIPQYLSIRKSRNAEGFSTLTSAILIISGILRIFFWFGKHFALSLLVQAVIMIICQLVLLELCVRLNHRTNIWNKFDISNYTSVKKFWKWNHFNDYLTFLSLMSFVLICLTILIGNIPIWVETIGTLSLFIESLLGVPQAVENYKKKSTKGLSTFLILSWVGGDLLKTVFYLKNGSPVQFIACGVTQVIVDVIIILQIIFYNK